MWGSLSSWGGSAVSAAATGASDVVSVSSIAVSKTAAGVSDVATGVVRSAAASAAANNTVRIVASNPTVQALVYETVVFPLRVNLAVQDGARYAWNELPSDVVALEGEARRRALIALYAKEEDSRNRVLVNSDVLASKVFSQISLVDLGKVAIVCKTWCRVSYKDAVWRIVAARLPIAAPLPNKDIRDFVRRNYDFIRIVIVRYEKGGGFLSGAYIRERLTLYVRPTTTVSEFEIIYGEVRPFNPGSFGGLEKMYKPWEWLPIEDNCEWPTNSTKSDPISKFVRNGSMLEQRMP